MWLPSAALLDGSADRAQSILIAQIWHELLSPSSPDSYRARALDVPLLLEELLRIEPYARQEPKWMGHVHLICDEIASHLPLDPNLIAPSTVAEATLREISRFKGQTNDLSRLKEQVQIVRDSQHTYVPDLLKTAETFASDSGNKKLLTAAMSGLATHVQMHGASDESLGKVTDDLCMLTPGEVVSRLCNDVNLAPREYSCFIAIAAARSTASSLFSSDLFRECGSNRFEADEVALRWYEQRPEGIVIELVVTAASRQRAADVALAQASNLNHLYALYANSSNVVAVPLVLVSDGQHFHSIEVTPSRHFGLEPRRGSERLARGRYSQLRGRVGGRLSNVLESHALAVAAADTRSAVFHLWTALETLASGLGSEAIGERVANVLAPIVAWRRIDKIVTYLAISAHELREHTGDAMDLTHMANSNSKHLDRSDLLRCLAGPKDNPGILATFSSCAKNPLLTFRLYCAWQELTDPRKLRKALDLSRTRIRWQTLRFYRTRNLLVHYGQIDDLALRLLENAQYYLSTCIGRVLHDLGEHPDWDINTSLEYHRQRFESLQGRLQASPASVTVSEVLVRASKDVAGLAIWPAPTVP